MDKSRVEYKVIKEHGIVVAEINDCSCDAFHVLNERFMQHTTSTLYIGFNTLFDSKFFMNGKYRGVARCHPDDEWNEEIGKRVALNKLIDSYHRSLNNHLYNCMAAFAECADSIYEYLEKRHFFDIEEDEENG